MKFLITLASTTMCFWLLCCSTDADTPEEANNMQSEQENSNAMAEVTAVSATGASSSYIFQVTIKSPDTGCDQYADWWEVLTLEGNLRYRRILTHSHVTEQPFTRGGGPIDISEDTEVYIRAHMNSSGYGIKAFKGSVSQGFIATELDSEFSKSLETMEPLPQGCAF